MSDRVIISQDEDGGWVADTISVPDPNNGVKSILFKC